MTANYFINNYFLANYFLNNYWLKPASEILAPLLNPGYFPSNYFIRGYFPKNYFLGFSEEVVEYPSITPGYWFQNYFLNGYWIPDYWLEAGLIEGDYVRVIPYRTDNIKLAFNSSIELITNINMGTIQTLIDKNNPIVEIEFNNVKGEL